MSNNIFPIKPSGESGGISMYDDPEVMGAIMDHHASIIGVSDSREFFRCEPAVAIGAICHATMETEKGMSLPSAPRQVRDGVMVDGVSREMAGGV